MAPKNTRHFATTVRETMSRLGLTQADVAARGGPSDTTLRKILEGLDVGVSIATLKKLDSALEWEPGSAARALEGSEPIPGPSVNGDATRVRPKTSSTEGSPALFAYGADSGTNPLTRYADATLNRVDQLLELVDTIPHDMGPGPEDLIDGILSCVDGIVTELARYSAHFGDGESFAYIQDRIRASTTRHATISLQRGRGVAISSGQQRPIVDGRLQAATMPFAAALGLSDVLSNYSIDSDQPFQALWSAGYRRENNEQLKAALAAASAKSDKRSGQFLGGAKFWKAFAGELGGTYDGNGFQLPPPSPGRNNWAHGIVTSGTGSGKTEASLTAAVAQYVRVQNGEITRGDPIPISARTEPEIQAELRSRFVAEGYTVETDVPVGLDSSVDMVVHAPDFDLVVQFKNLPAAVPGADIEGAIGELEQIANAYVAAGAQQSDHDLAARTSSVKSKGEALRDTFDALGEASQDPNDHRRKRRKPNLERWNRS